MLTVTDSTIRNNTANSRAGGILNVGSLTLTNSIVSNNSAFRGGGIWNEANGSMLTLTNSTVSNNIAADQIGGGIVNGPDSILIINSSTISGNRATLSFGGGILNGGTATITNSAVNDNTTSSHGGGIFNEGTLTLTNSTVAGNTGSHGGGILNIGTADLTSSTISNNTATIQGGGIRNDGPMTLSNSTVSGNSATNSGGGILNLGTADLTNSTISGNNAGVSRGGIFNFRTITLTNTTIAGNASPGIPDCDGFTSLGHNLIGTSDGCNFSPATGDLVNVDPMLAPLQDNGGPTFTHALIEGSPAIDAGDNSVAPDTDQRGVPRPLDGDADGTATSDIGAYEFVPPFAARIDAAVTGDEGASITFDGIRSTRGVRTIVAYAWNFGDGQTATFVWGEHVYSDDGIYTVTLAISDDLGATADATHQITIENVTPTITSVVASPSPVNEGAPTTITVAATDPAGANDPLQYFFDCDGNNIFEIGPQTGDNTASCTFPDGPASPPSTSGWTTGMAAWPATA